MIGRFLQLLVLGALGTGCAPGPASVDPATDLATGWSYFGLGEYDVAGKRFAAVSQSPEPAARLPGFYALGVNWHLRRPGEDWAKARQYYQRLIEEYPQDHRCFLARQSLARMNQYAAQWRAVAGALR